MPQRLRRGQPPPRVAFQQALHEVDRLRLRERHLLLRAVPVDGPPRDELERLLDAAACEGVPAGGHVEGQDAARPEVDGGAVGRAGEDFGGDEVRGADLGLEVLGLGGVVVGCGEEVGEAEVRELGVVGVGGVLHEDVFELEVAVDDAAGVEVLDGGEDVADAGLCVGGGHGAGLHEDVVEGAAGGVLHDDVDGVVGVEDVDGADDVGVLGGGDDLELAHEEVELARLRGLLLDGFHREHLRRAAIAAEQDGPERALPDRCAALVVLLVPRRDAPLQRPHPRLPLRGGPRVHDHRWHAALRGKHDDELP
eukprot:CAMPEP_0184716438 /NCGR_PEP_ID=MMETSP0314-20130426/6173_1 /TAXON_ID=38298 /ORGANISM="Rhodella maculata, Strain CCMP 736" /LENGTH=308 /DNA_ID=CAMNT_0027179839 /DNA_START=224 /DNA_END=1146 /DNA_ORIENTATION=+